MPSIGGMRLAEYFTPFPAVESRKPRIACDVGVHLGEFKPADDRPAKREDLRTADHEEFRAAGDCTDSVE